MIYAILELVLAGTVWRRQITDLEVLKFTELLVDKLEISTGLNEHNSLHKLNGLFHDL